MVFQIKQEKFEGPLELLFELIDKEKLSISEVSLAKVTDEYIQYVKSLEKIDPLELAEFIVIASQLMLIKSRTLLPDLKFTQEEEETIGELEKRLEEYKKMREHAQELKNIEKEHNLIFSREAFREFTPIFYPPRNLALAMLQDAMIAFFDSLPKIEKLAQEKIKRIISLEDKIKHIRSFLQNSLEKAFSEVVKGSKEKVEIIVSFLAILELARQKFVTLEQKKPFEDIMIKKVNPAI